MTQSVSGWSIQLVALESASQTGCCPELSVDPQDGLQSRRIDPTAARITQPATNGQFSSERTDCRHNDSLQHVLEAVFVSVRPMPTTP